MSEAEELASDITCEVYHSLLCADEIANLEGYVYRIASNIFARFIQQKKQENYMDIIDISLPFHDERFNRMENNETMEEFCLFVEHIVFCKTNLYFFQQSLIIWYLIFREAETNRPFRPRTAI